MVGAHSAAGWAVFWSQLAKVALFGENQFLALKSNFWGLPSKTFSSNMTEGQWDNFLVLTKSHCGLRDGIQGHFFFLHYTHKSDTFFIRQTQTDVIISHPHPEVTLDTFRFAVLSHFTAWWAVLWSQLAKMSLFGA